MKSLRSLSHRNEFLFSFSLLMLMDLYYRPPTLPGLKWTSTRFSCATARYTVRFIALSGTPGTTACVPSTGTLKLGTHCPCSVHPWSRPVNSGSVTLVTCMPAISSRSDQRAGFTGRCWAHLFSVWPFDGRPQKSHEKIIEMRAFLHLNAHISWLKWHGDIVCCW